MSTRVLRSASAPSSSSAMVQKVMQHVQSALQDASNTTKATQMQSYLKTDMPMYGLQKPERAIVEKSMYAVIDGVQDVKSKKKQEGSCMDAGLYTETVQELWNLPYREEKYLAIDLAMHYKKFITMDNLNLYEDMLREEYMWWDLCDPIAINLVGGVARGNWTDMKPRLKQWISDDNMWIRRTALLATTLKFKEATDEDLLFDFCRQRMHEKEFFIRKAIGWVLRDYSRFNPGAVQVFLEEEKPNLSGLSFREGSKRLVKQGLM